MGGALAYRSGLAAEDQVARRYQDAGRPIAARRWRGRGGEIDLIARDGAQVIFIEVKRADSHALAAERLGARQMQRIWDTASEFLAGEPSGQDTEVRFDVALVDGRGRIEIVENALGF
jgi:putative endonuclease